jgi:outer membrane protein OmpA-like peptidoglycan-associated protein
MQAHKMFWQVLQLIFRSSRGFLFILLSLLLLGLFGCASSTVSRSAAGQVDSVYENSNAMLENSVDNNPANAYQNASQTTKGVLLGGTVGAVAGGISSGAAGVLPGAAGGAVIGGVLGAYIDHHTDIRDQLENRGVKVLILGDQVMLVLSSDKTFVGMTSDMRPQSYSTLDLIANLINGFTTMSVKVGAYTNNTGDKEVNRVVSQQQANSIVKYLWPRLNTRVLTGMGYGGEHLIEKNNLQWAQGKNYRIEIVLEKLPT